MKDLMLLQHAILLTMSICWYVNYVYLSWSWWIFCRICLSSLGLC